MDTLLEYATDRELDILKERPWKASHMVDEARRLLGRPCGADPTDPDRIRALSG
ncbi:hypothetical protein [Bifidobacterium longum]|uniref:hypothetical protein n=1 Tax=Bifidobacterium longum TaxID=216816 RepID=UPI0001F71742|nr:hypothetical protein [Bifidobacterium longum]MBX4249239.1 hypothetical protein [Bifidobacterium longum subsp. infantis]MEE4091815.1 hypothetical protein [Bifidobacterium longum subsp. infantis]BAJ68858.1 hypothetical protein BLIJ_1271 [Bifidobacterium longum subsp. infantis ATCC 15697 = JCM 1222 = DSM 20088]